MKEQRLQYQLVLDNYEESIPTIPSLTRTAISYSGNLENSPKSN